ncbi:hypothetical protein D4764_15G0007020 [Takifugu flavidus]|uniref:C2H2-type domain-containing protein n=1 Tax=Takifugu flavidus TaxID=433684 RepID=A0A5C6P2C7_9TELE|nr:hypothetical protein D4764_15G0007020 [Takifugu flavidus]
MSCLWKPKVDFSSLVPAIHIQKIERSTKGTLVTVTRQCLQCKYRKKWESQASLKRPPTEDQYLTVGISPQLQQAAASINTHTVVPEVPQTVAVTEERDHTDDSERLSEKFDISDKHLSLDDEILEAGTLLESEGDENDSPLSDPARQQLCTDCGMFFSQQHPHMCLHKLKPHSCNFCGRRFVDLMSLNSHSRMHNTNYEHRHIFIKTKPDRPRLKQAQITKEKLYRCPNCFETSASKIKCSIHAYSHKGIPKFKCNTCGMQFPFKHSLKVHSIVHTGEKPFACSVCQRRFTLACNLKTHMRLHTGERPYKCQHCDQCFNQNISLKLHLQRYHTGSAAQRQEKNNVKTDTLVKKSTKAKDSVQRGKRGSPQTGSSKGGQKKNADD